MNMLHPRWLIPVIVLLAVVESAAAQETAPAGTEQAYLDLRKSEDRATKRIADRYYNLVRQQEWASFDNKQTVLAKYVAHDPNFKWVKLARVQGSGSDRVTRDVTVPLEKLSKTCQSRVRQIAVLQPKLDELIAAGPDLPAGEMADAGGEYGGEYGRPSRRMMADRRAGYGVEGGYESPASETPGDGAGVADASGREAGYSAVPTDAETGANDPDPLGFGELANEPPLEASAGYGAVLPPVGETSAPVYSPSSEGGESNAGTGGPSQWAVSYDAFLANFNLMRNERGAPSLDWGQLTDLLAMNVEATKHAQNSSADPDRRAISEIGDRLGEVRWQASVAGVDAQDSGEFEIRFDLAPLPDPLKIRFLATAREARMFSGVQPGEMVQFVGRFDIKTPNEIEVQVRRAN
jgi:hypothetical protein